MSALASSVQCSRASDSKPRGSRDSKNRRSPVSEVPAAMCQSGQSPKTLHCCRSRAHATLRTFGSPTWTYSRFPRLFSKQSHKMMVIALLGLLVMGTHAATQETDTWLGSTASKIKSLNRPANDALNPRGYHHKNWNIARVFVWGFLFAGGIALASYAGCTMQDFGNEGGASDFMKYAMIGVGSALAVTAVINFSFAISVVGDTDADNGVYHKDDIAEIEEYGKYRRMVSNAFAVALFIAVIALAIYASTVQFEEGELLIGKSMTFLTLLGMTGLASAFMYANYNDDDVFCKLVTKSVTYVVDAGKYVCEAVTRQGDGKRTALRFVLGSKTFWFFLLCVAGCISTAWWGDFEGNSLFMKTAIYTVTAAMIISLPYMCKRYRVYIDNSDAENEYTHAGWAYGEEGVRDAQIHAAPKSLEKWSVLSAFILISIVSLILLVLGFFDSGDGVSYFGGNGTGSIFTVMVLGTIGFGGFWHMYTLFKNHDANLPAQPEGNAEEPQALAPEAAPGQTPTAPAEAEQGDAAERSVLTPGSPQKPKNGETDLRRRLGEGSTSRNHRLAEILDRLDRL